MAKRMEDSVRREIRDTSLARKPYRISHLLRYGITLRGNVTSVYGSLASCLLCLQDSVPWVLIFYARVPSNMAASSLTPSSHRFLGFPFRLLQ